MRVTMSFMRDVYIYRKPASDLDNYRSLVDRIECMSAIFDDLRDRAIAGSYHVNDDVIDQAFRLIYTICADDVMTYDQCRQTLELATAIYRTKLEVDDDSMTALLAALSAFARKRTILPNEMEGNLIMLVYIAVDLMRSRLQRCVLIDKHALDEELLRSIQEDREIGRAHV